MDAVEIGPIERGIRKIQLLIRKDDVAVRHFNERRVYHDTRTTCLQKVVGQG